MAGLPELQCKNGSSPTAAPRTPRLGIPARSDPRVSDQRREYFFRREAPSMSDCASASVGESRGPLFCSRAEEPGRETGPAAMGHPSLRGRIGKSDEVRTTDSVIIHLIRAPALQASAALRPGRVPRSTRYVTPIGGLLASRKDFVIFCPPLRLSYSCPREA